MKQKSKWHGKRVLSFFLALAVFVTSLPGLFSNAASAEKTTLNKRALSGSVKMMKLSTGGYFDVNYKYTDAGDPVYCTQANGKSPTSTGEEYTLSEWNDYSASMKKGLYAILQNGYQGGDYPYGTQSEDEAYYATQLAVHLWAGHFGKDSSYVNAQAKAMTWTVEALESYADNLALPEKDRQFKVQNTNASKRAFTAAMQLLQDALDVSYQESTISLTQTSGPVRDGNDYVYKYKLETEHATNWSVKLKYKVSGVTVSPASGTTSSATITVRVPVNKGGMEIDLLAECKATGMYSLNNFKIFISDNDDKEQRVIYIVNDEIADAGETDAAFIAPSTGDLKIHKIHSATGSFARNLAGAEFTVYTDAACTKVYGTITIPDTGTGSMTDMDLGTYYVKETKTPDGYVADDTVYTVKITANETVWLDVANTPITIPITLTKTDEDGKLLTGATFGVYAMKNDSGAYSRIGTMTDNGDGTYSYTATFPRGTTTAYDIKVVEEENPLHYTGTYTYGPVDMIAYYNTHGTTELDVTPLNITATNAPEELYLELLKVDQNGDAITTKTEFSVTEEIDDALIAESVTFADYQNGAAIAIHSVTMSDGTVYSQQAFLFNGSSSSYADPGKVVVYYDGSNKAAKAQKGWYQFNDTTSGSNNMYIHTGGDGSGSSSWTYLGCDTNYGDVVFTAYPWSEALGDYVTEGIELTNNLKGLHRLKLTWTEDNQGKVKVVETATQVGYLPNTEVWYYDLNGSSKEKPVEDTITNIGKDISLRLIKQTPSGAAVSLNALTEAKFGIYEWDSTAGNYVLIGYHNAKGGLEVSGVIESTGIYNVTGLQYSEKNQGKFKWVELQPPKGYTIYGDQERELNIFADNQNAEEDTTIAYTSTFYNKAATGLVQVTKVDTSAGGSNGKLLAGAEFTLYRLIKSGSTSTEQKLGTLTDNHDGTYTYDGLTNGTYRVKETAAPEGYIGTAESIDFTIDTTAAVSDTAVRNFYAVVENTPYSGKVKITKTDSVSGAFLTGAEFMLQQWSETTGVYEDYYALTETSTGIYESDLLTYTTENKGKFRVVETKNPDGYSGSFAELIQLTENHQEYVFAFEAENTPYEGEVTVTKLDEVTGRKLAGAEFTVYEWNGSDYVTHSTLKDNGDGTYVSNALYYSQSNEGKFRIVETKVPYGYTQESAFTQDFEITQAEHNLSFTAVNERVYGSLTITKSDAETGTNVAQNDTGTFIGTVYTLYAKEDIYDNTVAKNLLYSADEVVVELAIGADGTAGIDMLPLGNYYLVETKAAEGYYVDETVYEVSLREIYEESPQAEGVGLYLELEDTPIKAGAAFTKADPFGKPLSGAGFSVYRIDTLTGVLDGTLVPDEDGAYTEEILAAYDFRGDTPVTAEVFADANGIVTIPQQLAGKYVIVETKVPTGYLAANPILWTVDESNTYRETVDLGTVVDELEKGTLLIEKRDEGTGKLVVHNVAAFRIFDIKRAAYVTDENGMDLFFTGADGTVSVDVYPGEYRIEEAARPFGYLLNAEDVIVTVTAGSTVTGKVYDTPMTGQIILKKTGEKIASVTTKSGETVTLPDGSTYTTVVPEFTYETIALAGAKFTITAGEDIYSADGQTVIHKAGDTVATLTTGKDGTATKNGLPLGTYIITETKAPDGYLINVDARTVVLSQVDNAADEDFGNEP